jgi:hypothetical protein
MTALSRRRCCAQEYSPAPPDLECYFQTVVEVLAEHIDDAQRVRPPGSRLPYIGAAGGIITLLLDVLQGRV